MLKDIEDSFTFIGYLYFIYSVMDIYFINLFIDRTKGIFFVV